MGQFNMGANPGNDLLQRKACVVCQKPGIIPSNQNYDRMSYDYICNVCNPNIIICISDHVLMSEFLDRLKENPEARKNLKAEITSYTGKEYKLYLNVLEYFLGLIKTKPITYHDWKAGTIAGHINAYGEMSQEDRDKISKEQKEIFDARVTEKLEHLRSAFNQKKSKSINPKMMLALEIESINDIIIKGRHVLDYKPIENENITVGAYHFKYYMLRSIRDMYESAVNGSLDYSIIPSEKQQVGIAALNAKVDSMVQAIAFSQFLNFLENSQSSNGTGPPNDPNTRFTQSGVKDLEQKIDDLKTIIEKLLKETQDEQRHQFYETQTGQEIIFNEFDELKTLLPTLTKKSWKQLLKQKLFDMATREILSKETAKWVWEKLSSMELPLDASNLLNP